MTDFFESIVGQRSAVDQLRAAVAKPVHAYLLVGAEGAGTRQAAVAFAAALLDDERAMHGAHPDVVTVEREGASINVAQAREISRVAARSPLEGSRKVLILSDFHLVDEAAPALLKTIEEASESTIFVILAESMVKELVTVASRCVRIDFGLLPHDVIVNALMNEGVALERANEAAEGSFGNLDRARLLAADESVAARRQLWVNALSRLDGTGAAAAAIADEIVASLDVAGAPLLALQEQEVSEAQEHAKEVGSSAAALKVLETRHKREQRRLRTDELRVGFATLAQELARRLQLAPDVRSAGEVGAGLEALNWANESLTFNPNETLLLQGLFVRLSESPLAASR